MTFKTHREILEEAVATGDSEALVLLGDYYADDADALISAPEGAQYAVALFLAEAQIEPFPRWRLAQAYALGRGVPARDFKEAFRWLRGCLRLILCRFRDCLRSYWARWKDYRKGRD